MRKFILFSMLVLCTTILSAQNRVVTGRVTGADDGLPLPQVSVFVKGTTNGVPTDADGNFRISVPADGAILRFQFIGYTPQEVAVGNLSVVNVILQPDAIELETIVFTGYRNEEKREIAGAIASVGGDRVKDIPTPSIERLIQGQAAGVSISAVSGVPGGATDITIRGIGSINGGNSPLWIIDGIQLNEATNAGFGLSSSPLSTINPNDIQSIEILKDAASTAVYGSQGANGVIIITTKKGASGKAKINFSSQFGIAQAISELDMMNSQEYLNHIFTTRENEAILNGFGSPRGRALWFGLQNTGFDFSPYNTATFADIDASIPQADVDAFVNSLPTNDWFNAVYRDGISRNYQLSASGGNENATYYLSGNYNKTEGQVIGSDYERMTFRANLDTKLAERVNLSTKVELSTVSQNGQFESGFFFESPFFAAGILPWNNIRDPETGEFVEPLVGANFLNPVKSNTQNKRLLQTNVLRGSFGLNYQITDNLSYSGTIGLDYRNVLRDNFDDPRQVGNLGSAFISDDRNVNYITTQTLRYDTQFSERHKLSGILVWEFRHDKNTDTNVAGSNVPNELFRSLAATATPTTASSFFTEYKVQGTLLNLKYIFDDRIVVNASARYDGSSRFGSKNRFGFFPAVNAAWQLGDEEFFNVPWVDQLKVRAGYGVNGNHRIGNFASRTLVTGGGAYLGQPAIFINGLGNDELTWEEQAEINVGVDFGFLQNRITGSIDLYKRNTTELLLPRNLSLAGSGGNGSINVNAGELENRGLEILVNSVNIDQGGFKWTTGFNISFQDQEILSLFEDQQFISAFRQVGQPIDVRYDFDYAGVNPATGRAMWWDRNGNLTYNPQFGSIGGDDTDRKVLGPSRATTFGGLNTDLSYKGISLSAQFVYQFGAVGREDNNFFFQNQQPSGYNQTRDLIDLTWNQPGDLSRLPIRSTNANRNNVFFPTNWSSINVQSRDFIRLKTLVLAYSFPSSVLNALRLEQLRVYGQATNLLTFTGYNGLDPEYTGTRNNAVFPLSKQFTVGVELGF